MVVEQKYNKKLWSLVWITVEWIENIKGGGGVIILLKRRSKVYLGVGRTEGI